MRQLFNRGRLFVHALGYNELHQLAEACPRVAELTSQAGWRASMLPARPHADAGAAGVALTAVPLF